MGDILRITDPFPSDDSIYKYKNFEYEPTSTTLEEISGYTSKLKIFLPIPLIAF